MSAVAATFVVECDDVSGAVYILPC